MLGYFFGVEFDALFVTALLTIIGFPVKATSSPSTGSGEIMPAGEPFGAIVNHSILQTLGRSINTSPTVVVMLSALLLLGLATIRTFTLALLIGVISGTYSSIFNASQLLAAWYEDAERARRWLRHARRAGQEDGPRVRPASGARDYHGRGDPASPRMAAAGAVPGASAVRRLPPPGGDPPGSSRVLQDDQQRRLLRAGEARRCTTSRPLADADVALA